MARIWLFCTLAMTLLSQPLTGEARESLRTLTGMGRDQVLDWRNPVLAFDLDLPPGVKGASLTLYADPQSPAPAPGSMMMVSANNNAGIVLAPKPQSFSARIDLPAVQLRAGRNHFRISFEGPDGSLCPLPGAGGWRLDLARSRIDVSVSPDITSFAGLEDWLGARSWSPERISIDQGQLDHPGLVEFGALIAQGLAVRSGRAPHFAPQVQGAELVFEARMDKASAGPLMVLHPGLHPRLILSGRDQQEVLEASRLFAARMLPFNTLRIHPSMLAQAPLVRSPGALQGLAKALDRPVWNSRPFYGTARAPHGGQTRLVIDLLRARRVSPQAQVLIDAGPGRKVKKRLKHRHNHFVIPLDNDRASVTHGFSIARNTSPAGRAVSCPSARAEAPVRLLDARIESSGFGSARSLARFAVDGAPFTGDQGAGSAIAVSANNAAQLAAAWQVLARLALVSGTPLAAAWYGDDPKKAPKTTPLLVLGPRNALPAMLTAGLPETFAYGGAAGPGEIEGRRRQRRFSLARTAFADTPLPPGLGVAGWQTMSGRPVLILTAETEPDFVPAMQALASGPALDLFAGRVLRWRAGLVEINAIDPDVGNVWQQARVPGVLFLLAALALAALWARLWRRAFERSQNA